MFKTGFTIELVEWDNQRLKGHHNGLCHKLLLSPRPQLCFVVVERLFGPIATQVLKPIYSYLVRQDVSYRGNMEGTISPFTSLKIR